MQLRSVLPLLAVGVPTALAAGQTGGTGSASCNHTTRRVDILAGDHNFSETTCQVLTISVAGVSYQTPQKCTRGGARYSESVYRCEGPLQNTDCNPRGWQVEYTVYSDGDCPQLPQLDSLSWLTWAEVPTIVTDALKCKAPKSTTKKDWSAKTSSCTTGSAADLGLVPGETYPGGSSTSFTAWQGELTSSQTTTPMLDPFRTPYDLAQSAGGVTFGGVMDLVAEAHAPVPGAFVVGSVRIDHYSSDTSLPDRSVSAQVRGSICSSTSFDLTRTMPVIDGDGNPDSSVHRTTYDGKSLRDVLYGGAAGNAYVGTWGEQGRAFENFATEATPLYWWTADPFELPSFQGVQFLESVASASGEITARRVFTAPNGAPQGAETYVIDVSSAVPHPLQRSISDPAGNVRAERVYSNYQSLEGQTWRPMQVRSTTYLEGTPTGARIVVTLVVNRSRLLTSTEAAAVPAPFPDEQIWQLWQ